MTNPKPDDGGEMKRARSQPVVGSVPLPTREAEEPAAVPNAERTAQINALGGYQHLFDAIASAVKPWPSKEHFTGFSVSVFDFVEALSTEASPLGAELGSTVSQSQPCAEGTSSLPDTTAEPSAAWLDIESAPRDGAPISVLYDDGTEEDGVYWSNERCCILGPRAGAYPPGWNSTETGHLPVGGGPEITHWKPLAALSSEALALGSEPPCDEGTLPPADPLPSLPDGPHVAGGEP